MDIESNKISLRLETLDEVRNKKTGSSVGEMSLKVTRNSPSPDVEIMKAKEITFYAQEDSLVLDGYFGGLKEPAVSIMSDMKLSPGTYPIKPPSTVGEVLVGIYGRRNGTGVGGFMAVRGSLTITELLIAPEEQSIKGSFEFIYFDSEKHEVSVVSNNFCAEYSEKTNDEASGATSKL